MQQNKNCLPNHVLQPLGVMCGIKDIDVLLEGRHKHRYSVTNLFRSSVGFLLYYYAIVIVTDVARHRQKFEIHGYMFPSTDDTVNEQVFCLRERDRSFI